MAVNMLVIYLGNSKIFYKIEDMQWILEDSLRV